MNSFPDTTINDAQNALSIVIPVYRSEEILPELHRRLTQSLCEFSSEYEIIFINDSSPDHSWEIIEKLAKTDSCIKAIALRKNAGYDNAIMAGLKFAKFPYVVIMDDDLQHAPEDIKSLQNAIKKGYDVVYANFSKKKQSFYKNLGSWLNGKLAQFILQKPRDISISSFKIIRREIAKEIVKYQGPYPYIDGLIFNTTSSIGKIPLLHNQRFAGDGHHNILRSTRIVLNFCTTYSIFPLRFATYLGFSISLVAFIFSMILVIWKLWFGINVEGWGSIMLAIVLMSGVQLLSMGVLGEYIGRTYMNINRQPQYLIKKVICNDSASTSENLTNSKKR
jgi:glycosyltransferase involved in cell wall biosynthesis